MFKLSGCYCAMLNSRFDVGICDVYGSTWTFKMPKRIDPMLPILSVLGCWAIILGTFGGPGTWLLFRLVLSSCSQSPALLMKRQGDGNYAGLP